MIKIVIVEDEENVRDSLKRMIELYSQDISVVAMCGNVKEGVKAINDYQPDLLLLDVELGKESSFDIFQYFPKPDFKMIFITAHERYAVQAFRFAALDYLLKPVDPVLLMEAIKRVSQIKEQEKFPIKINSFLHNASVDPAQKKIILKTIDNIHVVSLGDIMYCEADRSYTSFFLIDKSRIMVSRTMGEFEELFFDYGFFRIHQSYLLNLEFLKRYEKGDGGKAILKNGQSLPVATRKKDQLLELLNRL
jgi:two-component system LytT family response regulator